MGRQYSLGEARRRLGALVRETETSGPIQLTHRGKVVALLLSQEEYQRLSGDRLSDKRPGFWEAYQAFRTMYDLEAADIDPSIFDVRDAAPGRDVSFE
jgi:prevent-host-death family protein